MMIVILIVLIIFNNFVETCYIAGTDSGICVNEPSFDAQWRATNMPFCGDYVKYAACVPKQQVLLLLIIVTNALLTIKHAYILTNYSSIYTHLYHYHNHYYYYNYNNHHHHYH